MTDGRDYFRASIDTSQFDRDASHIQVVFSDISKTAEAEGARIDNSLKKIGAALAGVFTIQKASEFAKDVANVRGEFQQLEIAFETMLGSKTKSDALMSQLIDTAARTPFDLTGVANGAKQLLAYGTASEKVNETLIRLGDVASGLSIPLNDLVYLYGTTQVQGRLFSNDLNQFLGKGIPIIKELAKVLGVAETEIKDMVSAGKIGFPEVQKVIENLTNEGGMFSNLMEKQSSSITGQIANLEDAYDVMLNEIGKKSEETFTSAIDIATVLVENYEKVGEVLLSLVSIYGAYKVAVIALNIVEKSTLAAQYEAELSALSKLIPAKQASKNSDIESAVASGKLTEAKAAQLIAIRQEIVAKLDGVKANHALAVSEYEIALASHKATLQRAIASKAMVSQRQMELSLAKLGGDAAQIELAQKSLLQAQEERHIAVKARKASADALAISRSKANAASVAVETLQQNINNASTSAATVKTNLLTVAKTKLTAITRMLSGTMLANPYVLATMALVGLGYATYKLVTHQNDAEKAQVRLNDAMKEAEKSSISESRELARLKGELSAATKGTDEYNEIKEKIVKNYGKYYDGLEQEIEKVGLLEGTYNKLTEAIQKSFGARQYDSFIRSEQENLDNVMSENLGKIQDKLIEKLGDEAGSKYYSKIRKAIIDGTVSIEQYNGAAIKAVGLDDETVKALDKISGKASNDWITNYSIEGNIRDIIRAQKLVDELDKKARNKFGIEDNDQKEDNNTNTEIKKVKTLTEQTDEARKAVINLKQELANLRSGKAESGNYAKDIEEKTKDLKTAEDKLSYLLTGKASSSSSGGESQVEKTRKQTEAFIKAKEKQAIQEIRAAEDLEIQINEAELNAQDEGSKKVLAQMKLNYKKQKQALKRQQEDALQTKIENARSIFEANPENKGKTFDDTAIKLSEEELKNYQNLQIQLTASFEKDKYTLELQYMRDYISEYGTFQQKKLLITQEYDKKIAASHNEWEKKSLEAQKQGAISNIDFEAVSKQIDWQGVFGNITGMLDSQLKETLSGLKEYVKTEQFKSSSDTDKKTIYEAIEKLKSIVPEGQGTLNFNEIQKQMDDLGAAINRLQIATLNEKIASDNLVKAQKKYDQALKTGNQTIIESAKETLNVARNSANEASNAYKSAESDVENLGNNFKETAGDTVDGLNSVADGLHSFASNSLPEIFKGLQSTVSGLAKLNIGGEVGNAVGSLSKALSNAGFIAQIISAALSILDILKDGIGTLVANLIDTVLNAVDGILKNLLNGKLFTQILGSLKNGIGNILNTISFGGFNSLVSSINGSNAKETAEIISKLTSSNEALKVSVDALREEIEGTNGAKSIQAYNEAVNAQQRYNENLRNILDAQMGYHSSHHSNSYYWDLDKNSLNEVNKLLGTSLKNTWGDFSKLTADQMNDIRTHLPDVWSEMINQGKYGDRFKDEWNNYADQAGKVTEMTEALRENIAQISFDSLRDSFVNALMDMDSDAKDFAGNFEEYLTKALLNFAIGDLLDDQMKKWYESWADTINKQEGKLTDEQIAQYKKEWDAMVQLGIDKRDEIAALTGYTGNKEDERQATAKGVATASQDSVDENNGRLTVIQTHTYEINNNVKGIHQLTQGISSCMNELKTNTSNLLRHVQNIDNNTSAMKGDISLMRDDISNLVLHGVILKK